MKLILIVPETIQKERFPKPTIYFHKNTSLLKELVITCMSLASGFTFGLKQGSILSLPNKNN